MPTSVKSAKSFIVTLSLTEDIRKTERLLNLFALNEDVRYKVKNYILYQAIGHFFSKGEPQ